MTPDTIDRRGCGCKCGCSAGPGGRARASASARVGTRSRSGRMRGIVSRFIIRLVGVATDVRALICKPQTPTSDTAATAAASRFGLRVRLQIETAALPVWLTAVAVAAF